MVNRARLMFVSPTLRTSLADYRPRVSAISRLRLLAETALVFIGAWVLFLPYVNQPGFLDEFDNIIGGNVVLQGGAIYVDYWSQHTPVAYWFSALGQLLGATSLPGQRLFAYGVFALLLALLYLRNARTFGRIPLLVVAASIPLLHFANPNLSYTILSDNYQAIAAVFLLFEVVRIGAYPGKTASSWVVIGLGSALSFGVAFISAFFIATTVLTAGLLEIVNFAKQRVPVATWVAQVAVRLGALLAPVVALVAAVWSTGALMGAYQQAYLLNATTYSEYQNGLGSDALTTLVNAPVSLLRNVVGAPAQLLSNPELLSVRVAFFAGVLILVCLLLVRVRPILGVGIFVMATYVGMRGWAGFHSQPLWAFLIVCFALLFWFLPASGWLRGKGSRLAIAFTSVLVVSGLVLSVTPYAVEVYNKRDSLGTPSPLPNETRTRVIEILVPEGGAYAELGIQNAQDFVTTRRLPAGDFAGVVPWFSDMFDQEMTDKLRKDNPVLVFSEPDQEVWGERIDAHGPLLFAYINANYQRVNLQSLGIGDGVFIRKDAVESSLDQLRRSFPGRPIDVATWSRSVRAGEGERGYFEGSANQTLVQRFRADAAGLRAISVQTATFRRQNSGSISLTVREAGGASVASATWDASQVRTDDGTLLIDFPVLLDSLNKEYEIDIQWSASPDGNYLGLWRFPALKTGFAPHPLTVNGSPVDFALDFVVYF